MAITVNWATGVISVNKVDMSLVQTVPYDIYRLDVDAFRLILRDLEEDEVGGRVWPKTHDHNTEYTLSGTLYSRAFFLLDPYTVTFEVGTYVAEIAGADSNIIDKVNLNSVSVRALVSRGTVVVPSDNVSALEVKIDAMQVDIDNLTTELNKVKDQSEIAATKSLT